MLLLCWHRKRCSAGALHAVVFTKRKLAVGVLLALMGTMVTGIPSVGAVDGEITYTGANTGIYGDDSHSGGVRGPFNIGFTFNFYGTDYTQANVNTNGVLTFGAYYTAFSNGALSTSGQNNSIYAFWDDLITSIAMDASVKPIYYATIGAEPDRKFVVQWTNMYFYGTTIQMGTFHAILYEGSNDVQIQYRDLLGGDRALGNSATIGIKKDNSTYSQYSNNTASLTEGQAIRYSSDGEGGYTADTDADYDLIYLAPSGAPTSPTLVNPTDGSTGVTTTPTFEWLPVENASTYTVLISTVSSFSSTVVNASGLTDVSYTLGSPLSNSTQYYWRVQAVNSTGSSLSATRSFTTGSSNTAPDTPASVASTHLISGGSTTDASGSTLTATLSDADESEQVRFRIQIATDADFNSLVVDYRSPFRDEGDITYTVGETGGTYLVGSGGTALSSDDYYLRIRAEDDAAASSSWYTVSGVAFSVMTAPHVLTLSPANGATGVGTGANLVLTFDVATRAGTGTLTIRKTADGAEVETIAISGALLSGNGTTQLTLNPSEAFTQGTSYYVVWDANAFKNAVGVFASALTLSSSWRFTTVDTASPILYSISAVGDSDSATVIWSTDELSSSLLQYGTLSTFGSVTSEEDTGTGVTDHRMALSGLTACTTYYYRPISRDPSTNTGTGSTSSFITSGCTNSATVIVQTGSSITMSGGSLSMRRGNSGAALIVPEDASTNPFIIQIKKLDKDTVIAVTSTPSGVGVIGDQTYDIRAISGSVLVTSFLRPITVTLEYTDAQMSGYDETTLWIHRWDGSSWNALDDCSVDTSANTVTCTTTHFSTFGLFGDAVATPVASTSTATSESTGGRRGTEEGMAQRIESAQNALLSRFAKKQQESAQLAETKREPEGGSQAEVTATEREQRIAARKVEIARIERLKEEYAQKYAQHREQRMARAVAEEEQNLAKEQAALLADEAALLAEQETNAQRRTERLAEQERLGAQNLRGAAPALDSIAARRDRLYAVVNETPVLYADVPLSAWYAPYVSYAVEENIATGYADETGRLTGEFGVTDPVTFAEILKMALKASGKESDSLPPPRNVSARGTWASVFVAQAESMGLTVFAPDLDVHVPATRGAVIQTLLEVLGIPTGIKIAVPFTDVSSDHPYAQAIATAAAYGLIEGDKDAGGNPLDTFRPDGEINRAEAAKIISLAVELSKK
ncbi:MAG: S-layer homology domain-containing protein [Candidatus Peribacteraceae bacterium]